MQISSNGLISFGSPFTSFSPRLFPIVQQVIAPYWDDIILTNRGTVFYDSFNAQNGLKALKTVSNFINSVQWEQTDQFEASSVVVVYWRDTCPFGDSRCSKVSLYIWKSSSVLLMHRMKIKKKYQIQLYKLFCL